MRLLTVMITLALAVMGQTATGPESFALDQANQEAFRTTQLQLQVLYGQLELIRLRACLVAHYTMDECGQIGSDPSGKMVISKVVQIKPTSSTKGTGSTPTK